MEMKPKKEDDSEFKSRISRENTKSRRFSASYIRSFREDTTKSFRSNITISSTASSPGYPFKDEIDPSTYSFTTALKALQARSGYRNLEWLSSDGLALNSKWNEAEKYICNPLSGEVPMECLSAKTLSGRFFTTSNRITMSAPLLYSSTQIQTNPSNYSYTQQDLPLQFHIPEKKYEGMRKDAATQSSPNYLSSSNTSSSVLTPSIIDTSMKLSQDSTLSNSKTKSHEEEEEKEKEKERWETRKETTSKTENNEWRKKDNEQLCTQSGCFPWITNKRHKHKQRQRKTNIFLIHFNIC